MESMFYFIELAVFLIQLMILMFNCIIMDLMFENGSCELYGIDIQYYGFNIMSTNPKSDCINLLTFSGNG